MTLAQLGGLSLVYALSLLFILTLTYKEFRRVRFNFNVLFSLLYLLTFYFGFPLTCVLVFQFDVKVVPVENLLQAMLAAPQMQLRERPLANLVNDPKLNAPECLTPL